MKFVKINKKDISEICLMGNSVKEFEVDDDVVSFWPEHVLEKIVKSKNAICLKCVENDDILGFIIVAYLKDFSKATIENIFVKEEYRKQGIGRKLVLEVINILKKKNCAYLDAFTKEKIEEFLFWGFSKGNDFSWMSLCLDESFKK